MWIWPGSGMVKGAGGRARQEEAEPEKGRGVSALGMLLDGELVHPVEEEVAGVDHALPIAAYARDELAPCKDERRPDRFLDRSERIGLDPVPLELDPPHEAAVQELLHDPGALAAVNPKELPELALEHALAAGLDDPECLFQMICHSFR